MTEKRTAAVLDFGSGKILGLAAEAAGDGAAVLLKARAECLYNGFYDGDWIDRQNAKETIVKTLKLMESQCGRAVNKIYVGVPGEFTAAVIRDTEIKFNSPHKISGRNIKAVFDSADNFSGPSEFKPVAVSSTYFVLDGGKKVTDPMDMIASSVYAPVSFSFADKRFCSFVEGVIKRFGINKVEFVSSCLAQALYLFSEAEREQLCVLIDVGYATTSVSMILGDGLLSSKSFSAGGGNITDDLAQVLEVDYDVADELRRKVNLNLDFTEEDKYTAAGRDFGAAKVNDIVAARMEDIAEKINTCIDRSGFEAPADALVYLSGGGLCYMKGGVNCLSKYLGRRVSHAPVISPEFDRYDYNSGYGLLRYALKQNNNPRSFFAKLLGIGGLK